MMDPQSLRLAGELGGTLLGGQGGHLLLVERLAGHGLPQVLVLGRGPGDLAEPLAAIGPAQAAGLPLNLLALLPLSGCVLPEALSHHRRRLGALVAALDAGLPWLGGRPMLARRMPGRLSSPEPRPLREVPMGPLEWGALRSHLPDWPEAELHRSFRAPGWEAGSAGGLEADLWPGVPQPEGTTLLAAPLALPEATPLTDALRAALRASTDGPVPFLPLPGDPGPLHALRQLTPEATAFRGTPEAWSRALAGLATLPAPPHFCARC